MCGPIPPLPNTPSWHGAQFKKITQGQLYLLREEEVGKEEYLSVTEERLCICSFWFS